MSTKSPNRRITNLPNPLTSFIGREREIEVVSKLLGEDDLRLLTLTGPGGVGKTRLALAATRAVIEHFVDGAIFVDLAPLRDHSLVIPTVAQSVGLLDAGDEPLLEQLQSFLADKQILLVLDNFEHMTMAAPLIAELLASGSNVKALATSRAPLGVFGEHQHAVPPLTLPEVSQRASARGLSEFEATRLFVERARAAKSDFAATDEDTAAIVEICRRLDGLPLGVELAAGWINALPPAALVARLAPRLPLLSGGARNAPERHRTMRDAIAWSYDLLQPAEQTVFRRVAVFAGGFVIDSAKSVLDLSKEAEVELSAEAELYLLSLVRSLVEKSLISLVGTTDGEPRYAMLETIREFGLEQLSHREELRATRDRHAMHYWRLVTRGRWDDHSSPGRQHDFLEAELANIGSSFDWLFEQEKLEVAAVLLVAMSGFWNERGQVRVGRSWHERLLCAGTAIDKRLQFGVLAEATSLASHHGDIEKAIVYSTDALQLLEEEFQDQGELFDYGEVDPETTKILGSNALTLLTSGDFEGDTLRRAIQLCERSLNVFRALPSNRKVTTQGLIPHILTLSELRMKQHAYTDAEVLLREALGLAQDAGDSSAISEVLWQTFDVARAQGDDRRALSILAEAQRYLSESHKHKHHAFRLLSAASLLTDMGDHGQAAPLLLEALALGEESKDPWVTSLAQRKLGDAARAKGDLPAARVHYEATLQLVRQLDSQLVEAHMLGRLGDVYLDVDDYPEAMLLYRQQLTIYEEIGFKPGIAGSLRHMGRAQLAQANILEASRLCERALALSQQIGDTKGHGKALCELADIARETGELDRALMLYRQSIAFCLAERERRAVGLAAVRLADLEVSCGELVRAARVLGMLIALGETTALSLDIGRAAEVEQLQEVVESRLGQASLVEHFGEGRALLELAQDNADRDDTYETILAALAKSPDRPSARLPHGLTRREFEVLQLLAQGMSDREIGDALSIGLKTVGTHVSHVLDKLGVGNRTEATAFAHQHGLL